MRAVFRPGGGAVPRVVPTLVLTAGGERRELPMKADGDGFTVPIDPVDRSFVYHVVAEPQTSRRFTVSALIAPKVKRIDAHYEYPAFTGLAPRDEEEGGDVYAPAGTRVRLRVHTDRAATSGTMSRGERDGAA